MKKTQPVFLIVPRKMIIAWVVTTVVLFIGVVASFQYTNYVDRRSNGLWCGVVNLFDDTYDKNPPATETGKTLAKEFDRLQKGFHC